jgi:hypothetical protein
MSFIKYFSISYWQKRKRRCNHCGFGDNKNLGQVQFGIAFDNVKPKRYWHEFCFSISQNMPTLNYKRGGKK